MQSEIDFSNILHSKENNSHSQAILEDSSERLSKQCRTVLNILKTGVRLTVRDAMLYHGISSLPRRILDLKQKGVDIKWKLVDKKYKEYYL